MRRVFGWMLVVALCCAAGGEASEEKPDARLAEAQAAFDEAITLRKSGGYAEALPRAERALALRQAVLGDSHPDVASCLALMGTLYSRQGAFAQAEPLFQRALSIQEAGLGKSHPDVARTLNGLAVLYDEQGLYGQAEPLLQRALSIREEVLGKNHPEVALTLNSLAVLYFKQGLFGQAEPLLQRVLAIREEALGKNHPEVAQALSSLAALHAQQGSYGQAESLLQRALTIQEAAPGNDPAIGNTLNNLATLSMDQGSYDRAEPLYQRALAILEAAFGKKHPAVAQVLNNLATVYAYQGLYSQAEPLLQRALAIREEVLGKGHPDVAQTLYNLANLYENQGLYGRAEPLLNRALAIQEEVLGKGHPAVAMALNNLAILYWRQGSHGQTEPLLQRALGIWEKALGENHPDVARALVNLAILYESQGSYARAESLNQRALTIWQAAYGKKHPFLASALLSLANLAMAQGLHGRATTLYQRALSIWEETLGKDHPDVALALSGLAQLRLTQHRLADALPLYTRAFSISELRLRREALDFSESRLASFLHYLRADEQALYSLLREHPKDARVRRLALGAVLLLKGRSVEETANISRTLYRRLGAGDRETFERLRGLRTQLADLSLSGIGTLSPEAYQQRLKTLAGEGDALEADLARRSAPLRALTTLPTPAEIVDRVAASLPRDGALVEFIAYRGRELVPRPGTTHPAAPEQLRYLALVLLPDGSTRAVDLGAAGPIDLAASRLRNALANRDATFQAEAESLYHLAFKPLRPLLGTTRRLFLSPDGQLGLVPFDALHDGRGFLLDSFDFVYLTSGRELLPRAQDISPASSVSVFADPDFTAAPRATSSTPANISSRAAPSDSLERFFSTTRGNLVSSAWVPLPGTRQEAENIQRLLPQAQLFLGPDATKDRLLSLSPPGILHLATHGFFLEDAPAPPAGSRAVGHFGVLGEGPLTPRPEDPLLRSGLALAGARASAPDASTSSAPRPEAALVTALELAGLDLWGTQLVVLSACDTGRGDVRLGQGVYGLRRALVVTGAETVVMSLWKVNDDSTRLLMEAYYQNLLAGQGRASALREAMRSFRASRPHPHYWAPFIALGSDAPLRAIAPIATEPPTP
ncbi:CHAT domain-containing protein [Archangium lipolyticum]|uniref:CHAT domain-containing protein n=1 Tax=Archangium lipolyticum TaxID=2970465 RepID=UPI002149F8F3|nr:CHAT domain-containing protein [Archangium lipolyticum]